MLSVIMATPVKPLAHEKSILGKGYLRRGHKWLIFVWRSSGHSGGFERPFGRRTHHSNREVELTVTLVANVMQASA
jgi:hypothetical protein